MSDAFSIQSRADDVPADVHAEDRGRVRLGLLGRVRELDAAGLAAAADEHLRLDDDLAAELLGSGASLLGSRREAPLRHRNAGAREQLLSLVFVEIHGRARVYPSGSRKTANHSFGR